ncbi:tripartite tricarboxylate transporter TctB family protein [Amorphus sp. 3PC139-8]|uniref:tripartite tricarboxylate transporter TctB family protein n=1 Tax=Amorphus sp. 3PC139-8 TaxID=2735676 RepID=UPI00345CF8A6
MGTERHIRGAQYADIAIALVLFSIGVGFSVVAYGHGLGSLRRIGPGAMPFLIGCMLSLCALACLVNAVRKKIEVEVSPPLPVALIIVAVIAWALLVEPFGLVPATIVLMLIGTFAYGKVHWMSTLIVIAAMCVGCVALFIYGFRLPFTIFGG